VPVLAQQPPQRQIDGGPVRPQQRRPGPPPAPDVQPAISVRAREAGRALPLDAVLARAVEDRTGAAVLARKKLHLPSKTAGLANIRAAVKAYNKIHSSARKIMSRLARLRAVDDATYAWYAALGQQAITGPTAAIVGRIARESENEFAAIIAKYGDRVLPIDTSQMTQPEIDDAQDLWDSIVGDLGRIRVQGSDDYVKRSRANLAKILNTPTGRKLLTYLDQPGTAQSATMSGRVVIADELPAGMATDGLDVNQKSYAKAFGAQGAAATDQEQRLRLRNPKQKFRAAYSQVNAPTLAAPGPTGLEQAIFAGRRKVKIDGKYYEFGAGATGAFVHTIRATDLDQDIPDTAGNVAYTPEFITLAHELGHAMHHIAGATTDALPLANAFYPGGPAPWTNPEELFTITGIDNAIRDEAGLESRASHATLPSARAALKTQRRDELMGRAQTLYTAANGPGPVLQYMQDVADSIKGRAPLVEDDVYVQMRKRLVKLEHKYA
jgi:hypothetical protein